MNDYSFIIFLKGWENESGFQIGRNGIAETGKPACLFQDQYMTYEELAGKIKAFANGLEDRGLKRGSSRAAARKYA